MRESPSIIVDASPSQIQMLHLLKQRKYVKDIMAAGLAIDPPVNPFGQSLDSFRLQLKDPTIQLWSSVNVGMQGFSPASLAADQWKTQFNLRAQQTATGFLLAPEPNNAIYVPTLNTYAGDGWIHLVSYKHISEMLPANSRVTGLGFVFGAVPATDTEPAKPTLKLRIYYTTRPHTPSGPRRGSLYSRSLALKK